MEWISVDDRLPDLGQCVICYGSVFRYPIECDFDICIFKGEFSHSAHGEEMKLEIQEGYKWPLFENVDSKGITRNYTHWMPLPEPPNNE